MPYVKFMDGPLRGQEKFLTKVPEFYKSYKIVDKNTHLTVIYKLRITAKHSISYLREKELFGFSRQYPYEYYRREFYLQEEGKDK